MREVRAGLLAAAGGIAMGGVILLVGAWAVPGIIIAMVGLLGLYRIEWGLYGLIFMLPFTAVEGRVSETLVQEFKRVAVLAIAAAWVIHVAIERRAVRFPRPIIWPIVVLCSAAALSILRAPERGIALSSTGRLVAYITVYVVVTADVLGESKRLWRAVQVLLVSATITATFGLYQLIAFYRGWPAFLSEFYQTEYAVPRIHSFMQEPLWLSNYLLVVVPIAFALFSWRERTWPWLSLIAAATGTAGIVIAASRLGWATLVFIGPLSLVLAWRWLRVGPTVRFFTVVLVVLIPLLALWAGRFASSREFTSYFKDFITFGSTSHGEGDLRGRIQDLSLLSEAIRTCPVIGIGTNNVGFQFFSRMPIPGPQISTTHNTYLDALMETGGLGLIAFTTILFSAIASAWRGFALHKGSREGSLCFGICMGIVAMCLHLTNWSGWREAHVWFALGLAFAVQRAFPAQPDPERPSMEPDLVGKGGRIATSQDKV